MHVSFRGPRERKPLIHGSFYSTCWHLVYMWWYTFQDWRVFPDDCSSEKRGTDRFNKFLSQQIEITSGAHVFAMLGTHPLLPQLLLQRCQTTFLPQHAAVPPAEWRIYVNQLMSLCTDSCWGRDQMSPKDIWEAKQRPSKTWEVGGKTALQRRKSSFEGVPWWRLDQ